MKACPTCDKTYDGTLLYCTEDGTRLVDSLEQDAVDNTDGDASSPLVALSEQDEVDGEISSPFGDESVDSFALSRGRIPAQAIIAGVLLLLAVGIGLLVMTRAQESEKNRDRPVSKKGDSPNTVAATGHPDRPTAVKPTARKPTASEKGPSSRSEKVIKRVHKARRSSGIGGPRTKIVRVPARKARRSSRHGDTRTRTRRARARTRTRKPNRRTLPAKRKQPKLFQRERTIDPFAE